MITCYIDGLCEPNPNGVGTFACIIKDGKKEIYRGAGVISEGKGMSSNVSEYCALLNALKTLDSRGWNDKDIVIYTDSQVLAKQMSGEWKAVTGYYLAYYLKAKALRDKFTNLKVQWIPREENEEADAITKEVYEGWCRVNHRRIKYVERKT